MRSLISNIVELLPLDRALNSYFAHLAQTMLRLVSLLFGGASIKRSTFLRNFWNLDLIFSFYHVLFPPFLIV